MSRFLLDSLSLRSLVGRVKIFVSKFSYSELTIFFILLFIFIATRVRGFGQVYHQDEYKWATIVDRSYGLAGTLPHPPLSEALYYVAGSIFGHNSLRIIPIVCSFLLLLLVINFVRRHHGASSAMLTAGILVISLYSLIASLQIDIDGAILPVFVLLAITSYMKFRDAQDPHGRIKWAMLFVLICMCGFLSKLSFVLVLLAIACDSAPILYAKIAGHKNRIFSLKLLGVGIAIVVSVIILLITLRHVIFIEYIKNFLAFSNRDFQQAAIQTIKAIIFSSPLLIGGIILGIRYFRQLRIWYCLLAVSALFYLVIFDFTHRTLDRYLMFIILPGAIITGVALANEIKKIQTKKLFLMLSGITLLLGACIHALMMRAYDILPFIPKTAFFDRVKSLDFSFLIPLTGGSGPAGFYLPAQTLIILWVAGLLAIALILYGRRARAASLILFLSVSLVYNFFGNVEFLTGAYYGSLSKVVQQTTDYILQSVPYPGVITFNDTGAWELLEANKYVKRFYIHPLFAETNISKFKNYSGYYMIVDFPPIGTVGPYAEYFRGCTIVYQTRDKLISGTVYDCRNAPPLKIQ